jgi:hypothetical protein
MPAEVLPDAEDGPARVGRLSLRARESVVFEGPQVRVVTSGETAKRVTLNRPRLEELLRSALALSEQTPSYVWADGDSELVVHATRTRVALIPGTVLLGIPVECDQTGPAEVAVPFAIGRPDFPAGMVMSAPRRPDGPPAIVERWGAIVVAAAYRALLDVITAAAATAGVDRDGNALIPGAVTADERTLVVTPQARHAIDRGRLL